MNGTYDYSRRNFLYGSTAAAFGLMFASATPGRSQDKTMKQADISLSDLKPQGVVDEAYWSKVRSRLNLNLKMTFLNNGTLGPTSSEVLNLRESYDALLATDPTDCFRIKELAEVRELLAGIINAKKEEVSLTHSTSEGLNIFAHGLDWKSGDEVIIGDQEHFAAVEPYQTLEKRNGIKIVSVPLPIPPDSVEQVIQAYARAFTARTRVLVVSQVTYVTGLIAPLRQLAELAHSHNALISVDGAQSFGVLPLDVVATGIDHFAAAGQKWLLAGTGTGVNFIRKELQSQVWPLYGYDDPMMPIPRYERGGQLNIPAAVGMGGAVRVQTAIGQQNLEAHARQLGSRLRNGLRNIPGVKLLSSQDPNLAANITSFTLHDFPPVATAKLLAEREHIIIRGLVHGEVRTLRASTHFYNTPEQIDQLLTAVRSMSENPPEFESSNNKS